MIIHRTDVKRIFDEKPILRADFIFNFSYNSFYRATTGDCKPCMRCCADSKDEDIEKQCKAQTNLPANQICRYDVDTIKCAPTAYRTTAPAVLVSTAPVMSQDMMAARTKEGKNGSTLLFISFASCLAFFVCLLLAVMLAFYYKKKILASLWCSGRIDGVIITRKYSRARESHR